QGDNGGAVANGAFGSLNEILDMARATDQAQYDTKWLARNLDVLGSQKTYQALPAGWSHALNTPFPWFKRVASHLGAVRNGLVVAWPEKIQASGIRNQYHHVTDVMPTILEAAQLTAPTKVDGVEQQPINGKSMLYSFFDADAESTRDTQYYEISGNHALYHKGWLANTKPEIMPWERANGSRLEPADYAWELYDLSTDFSQSNDVASAHPQRLKALQALFDKEARAHNVYPLQNTSGRQRAIARGALNSRRQQLVMWGKNVQVAERLAPSIFSHSFSLEAEIEIPKEGGEGVVFAAGSHFGGWSFYIDSGHPIVEASSSPFEGGGTKNHRSSRISARIPSFSGWCSLRG
ncbi:MAG: sulfatase-like hydrolase/transferase, partial [Pseudomonadales bacterium]|nr:sulfatase-like hydrolase/transferase [Pseudomonadales bacterium]